MTAHTRPPFAEGLKSWRAKRSLSQLELALDANVSARHIAFLETGRAKPSRDMVLRLADCMRLPLRARNELLEQAGFVRAFHETGLADAALEPVRAALMHMLESHRPYPALICDRHWNLVEANGPAHALLTPLRGNSAETNMVRMMLCSESARALIINWADLIHDLSARLRLELGRSGGDPVLAELVTAAEAVLRDIDAPATKEQCEAPFVPVLIRAGERVLSIASIIAEFGTPRDITVSDLRIELFFPGDADTEAFFRAAG